MSTNIKQISFCLAFGLIFSGCCIYKKYEKQKPSTGNLYGQHPMVTEADTTQSIATIPWTEMFTDPLLQNLIVDVLTKNTDLQQAHLQVQKMEAALVAAKLAFLPSLQFDPGIQHIWGGSNGMPMLLNQYSVGLTAQWQVDIFGKNTTAKRKTQAQRDLMLDLEQATKVELIAATVVAYYNLILLDEEKRILHETDSLWQIGLATQKALMEAGQCYSTAVNQLEASILNVQLQLTDINKQIVKQENSICLLLHETPHTIMRGTIADFQMPQFLGIGVPAYMLQHRPDVRAAERQLEAAYYGTCGAYAAMFPSITISGTFGVDAFNPVQLAASAAASLLQPIFAQGALQANLKISKAEQESARLNYEQKVLSAGVDVNEALIGCKMAQRKAFTYAQQVAALTDASTGTAELMNQGKATYLEVITARESLLSAKLNQAVNGYDAIRNLVNLYVALGGGE